MLVSMPRIRRRAAMLLLAWMALGLFASAHAGAAARQKIGRATGHCHEATPPPCGEPARDASRPGPGAPCQWPIALVCCQQPMAADAATSGPVMLGVLWVRGFSPMPALLASRPRIVPATASMTLPPALERSVILQV
jgi:hypothetical protein